MLRRHLVIFLVVVAAGAGLGWYGWRRYTAPQPPAVDLAGADPALAEVIETARRRVREEPYAAGPWARLGKVLRGSGYRDPAAFCFAHAEAHDPDNPRWPYLRGESLLRTDPATAVYHLRRAVADWDRQGDTPAAARLGFIEALLGAGLYDEAGGQLARGLGGDPDDPNLWLARGQLALARDDPEACRTCLLRCQDSPFTRQRACAQLAAVCRRLGAAGAALDFGRRAAALPPDLPVFDPLVAECQQLVVGRPDRLRQVDNLEERKRFREAVAVLRELAADAPDVKVYVALGRNLAQVGDLPGAEAVLRRAVGMEAGNVQANYYLSKVLWARGDYAAAAEAADRALAAKPDHGLAHMVRGLALGHLGRADEGLDELRRAVACTPDSPEPWRHLAEALEAAGRHDEARRCREQLQKMKEEG
jgi:tetratricopeptide (TPR) repeat protein